jgi:hypothetical protein
VNHNPGLGAWGRRILLCLSEEAAAAAAGAGARSLLPLLDGVLKYLAKLISVLGSKEGPRWGRCPGGNMAFLCRRCSSVSGSSLPP